MSYMLMYWEKESWNGSCPLSHDTFNKSYAPTGPRDPNCSGMVMSLFIRSGQNHLASHSERGKKTRQTQEEVERQHQGMDRPGVRQVPEGRGEQGEVEKTGCKIICGAPTTLAVKGLMRKRRRKESAIVVLQENVTMTS